MPRISTLIIGAGQAGLAMSLGHTLLVTEEGPEVLSKLTPEYKALV